MKISKIEELFKNNNFENNLKNSAQFNNQIDNIDSSKYND